MKLEIVNHTHHYHRLLAWQMSSLVMHPTHHDVQYTVFFDPQDEKTNWVVMYYWLHMPKNVKINIRHMPVQHLRNRATGRNAAALDSKADWIWFTDTDYVFGDQCLNELGQRLNTCKADLAWPGLIQETDWPTGDEMIRRMNDLAVRPAVDVKAATKVMNRAIGGVQLVRGVVARDRGYCPHMAGRPSDYWNFRSDVVFRKGVERRQKLMVPNVLRIRHTNKGYGQDNCLEVVN